MMQKIIPGVRKFFPLLLLLFLTACDDVCPTVQDYKNEGISTGGGCMNPSATYGCCLLCGLFEIITKAASDAANMSWKTFAPQLPPVVAVAASIYIAIFTLKSLGSFTKQNAADYMTGDKKGLLMLMFKTAVIILLLQSEFLINTIIIPIEQAGLEIGTKLAVTSAPAMGGAGSGWDGLFKMVNDYVKEFNDQAYETVAIGEAMVCNGTRGTLFLGWHWLMLCYGIVLFCFGWILVTGISFYIVDILIRLAFGAILLPFGVAAAISGQTVGYSKKIWNIFLNTFFSFILLGIMLGIAIQLINLGMTQGDPDGAKAGGGAALNMFLTDLNAQINENQIEQLSKDLWSHGSLLLTIVCFCVIVQIAAQMGKLAEKISGTSGITSAGSQVAAPIGKGALGGGKKIGGTAAGWAATGGKWAGHVAARITRADKLYKWGGRNVEGAQGFLTGTGKQGYRAWWHKK